ncbi:MAG: S8 family serine peptidase [Actinomycetota bacterium]
MRRVLMLLALLPLMAGALVFSDDSTADEAGVGVLSPSSEFVELLGGDEDDDDHVTLNELRNATLQNFQYWGDGSGVDVALIDTGVSPVDGLDDGRLLHGPDLSSEGGIEEVAFLDTYGHGTHLAGIIAGDRNGAQGIAPAARIVSVKVAGRDGVTTVPQVVAAIDWVIEHGQSDGLNIRVLNLSLGLAGVDDHRGDLLSAAVERAWDAGIFVVVAGGNDGDTQAHLDSPAIDPYVMAVAAVDTTGNIRRGYTVPDWSAMGDGERNPDSSAAGRSIASYRVPGSAIDEMAPGARVGNDLFTGSGTSQSAAVVSGLAARLFSILPMLDNDDVKTSLIAGAFPMEDYPAQRIGDGAVDGQETSHNLWFDVPAQVHEPAAGDGTGIVTPTGATWSGGQWNGATWSGATWSGATWSGGTWSGATWSGATWSGATWSGATWSGATWSGATWSGATWSGATWSGATWSGSGWV